MKVSYDTTYFQQGEEIRKKQESQENHLNDILGEIVSLKTRGDSDFEGLTELYRRIFIFLVVHSNMENFEDRALERNCGGAGVCIPSCWAAHICDTHGGGQDDT